MDAELQAIYGCLKHLRTPDEVARRRYLTGDEDEYFLDFGSPYEIDALNKILPSKGIRRLAGKTQVLSTNSNAHIRTRVIHTFEVVGGATLPARITGLNEHLTLSGSVGHDLGHTPFGHVGERFVAKVTGKNFRHEVFGVVVAQSIERGGRGLNLTHQTLEVMLNHSRGDKECKPGDGVLPEADVVMFCDKIAYIWADINDIFFRTKILNLDDFSELKRLIYAAGSIQRERTESSIRGLCLESAAAGRVVFEKCEAAQIFHAVKKRMYDDKVYAQADAPHLQEIMTTAYECLCEAEILKEKNIDPAVAFALMTDNDVSGLVTKLQMLQNFGVMTKTSQKDLVAAHLDTCSVSDIIKNRKTTAPIDFMNPDMDW